MAKYTVTKQYRDLPAAHRQPNHNGHCRWVHGHNWGFDVVFTCESLDGNGFVVDVGKLKPLKEWLERWFDHTLLINEDDPWKDDFLSMHRDKLVDLRIVPNCGMERLAQFVFEGAEGILQSTYSEDVLQRGLRVVSVTCWEDSKNSACYEA